MKIEKNKPGNTIELGNLELDPELYVHGIELGNEIWNGSGKIEISQMSVALNSRQVQIR